MVKAEEMHLWNYVRIIIASFLQTLLRIVPIIVLCISSLSLSLPLSVPCPAMPHLPHS